MGAREVPAPVEVVEGREQHLKGDIFAMKNPTFEYRFAQIVIGLAGVYYLLAGIGLLLAPVWFFQNIGYFPPFNRHYEGDLGSFIMPLGLGLLIAARYPARFIGLVWAAALASLLHAGNHIYDALLIGSSISVWFSQIGPLLVVAVLLIVGAFRISGLDSRGQSKTAESKALG
jgi:predicted anti-sigma-YlaC factor YlaD